MPNGWPDPEAGWMYMENNGPIVACPICNRDERSEDTDGDDYADRAEWRSRR